MSPTRVREALPEQRSGAFGTTANSAIPDQRDTNMAAEMLLTKQLTERERAILLFEQRHWRNTGRKEQAIREIFDLSATRYHQILNGLLDRPEALAAQPILVHRLRRIRAAARRQH